jgi:hypothetical protein
MAPELPDVQDVPPTEAGGIAAARDPSGRRELRSG